MSERFYNDLEIIGTDDQVKKVLEFIKGEPDEHGCEMYIDFNKINYMPDQLQKRQDYEKSKNFNNPNYINDPLIHEKPLHRVYDIDFAYKGYDWCCENWGSQYNAYNQEMKDINIISFITYNGNGFPAIRTLSKIFPQVAFVYSMIYEDPGCDDLLTLIVGKIVKYFDIDYLGELILNKDETYKSSSKLESKLINCLMYYKNKQHEN